MNKTKKFTVPLIVAGTGLVGILSGTMISAFQANAATDNTTTAATSQTAASAGDTQRDPSVGGHVGANGVKEVVLTGDTAEKVKAAALAANPGGTIERVENDAEGATYEAHMTKSDGAQITVKLDSSFKVTGTETGHGNR